ncbi:alpha/beta hydrolase [Herbiconiux sp. 11R-BC]|uniref:alpha/beta hydrolase n=1 Tax=Herbiconiux sp. 11R-BC TaxID=3111637 RepID=UPI003C106DB1
MTTDVLDRAARRPDRTESYGPLPDQVIDRFEPDAVPAPAGSPRPLVVLLHGGFWRQRYDRTHLHPLAEGLAASGFRVAVPEYRRVGGAGGFPATFDDVVAALRTLRAGEPGPLAVVGHSAGGHLAVWSQAVAGDGRARAERVVSLAGVLDLAEAHRLGLSSGAVGELLGAGTPGFDERLAGTDPMVLPWPGSRGVATVLLHGDADEEVPAELSIRYAARHPGTELHTLAGVGHYELIDPRSAVWPVLLRSLTAA